MTDWLKPLNKILSDDVSDLRALAERVGAKPRSFYVGQDLSLCNLSGQDLRGLDLTDTGIHPGQLSHDTLLDPQFDPRFIFEKEYVQIRIREEIYALALAYWHESSYTYKAWAIKNLLEYGIYSLRDKETIRFIRSTPQYLDLTLYKKASMRRFTLQIYPHFQESVHDWKILLGEEFGPDSYGEVLLAGMVKRRLRNLGRKDYSSLDPMAMFAKSRHFLDEIRRGVRF